MKYQRTPKFKEDCRVLSKSNQDDVNEAFPYVRDTLEGNVEFFKKYKIKKMKGSTRGIWEGHIKDNLCFTFHYEFTEGGEKVCFFRRVGTHDIYNIP